MKSDIARAQELLAAAQTLLAVHDRRRPSLACGPVARRELAAAVEYIRDGLACLDRALSPSGPPVPPSVAGLMEAMETQADRVGTHPITTEAAHG